MHIFSPHKRAEEKKPDNWARLTFSIIIRAVFRNEVRGRIRVGLFELLDEPDTQVFHIEQ